MNKQEQILKGNLVKTIFKLSIPVIIANFIQQLYNLADVYFVGRLGGTQIAAITFAWPLVFLIISLGGGMSIAGISMISQSIGRRDEKETKENTVQLLLLAGIVGSVIAVLGFIFSGGILELLGLDGLLLKESSRYIKWVLLATPATFITLCHSAVRKAEGNTLKPMIVNLISVISNVILNPLLIFNMGLGISGAGIATAIARFGVASYCIYELITLSSPAQIDRSKIRINTSKMKEIIRVGIPVSISQATTSIGFLILNIYVKEYGDSVLAAYGLGNRIHSIFFMIAQGISATLSAIVGQNYGAKNYKRVREAFSMSMKLSIGLSFVGAIINQIFTKELAMLFATNEEVVYHAVNYMRLVSWTVIAWGIFQVHNGFFQGLGETKVSLKINVIRLWGLRIPMAIVLTKLNLFNEYSVWNAMFWSNVATAVVSTYIYRNYMETKFKCIESKGETNEEEGIICS